MPVKRTSKSRPKSRWALTREEVGRKYGFVSGLEARVADELAVKGVDFLYEEHKVLFTVPERQAHYTPDFVLTKNGIIVETKGRFLTVERHRHILIKQQHPDLDIRLVFANAQQTISKTSRTTYAGWCQKHGIKFAEKSVPPEWINEPPCRKRLAALEKFRREGGTKRNVSA